MPEVEHPNIQLVRPEPQDQLDMRKVCDQQSSQLQFGKQWTMNDTNFEKGKFFTLSSFFSCLVVCITSTSHRNAFYFDLI